MALPQHCRGGRPNTGFLITEEVAEHIKGIGVISAVGIAVLSAALALLGVMYGFALDEIAAVGDSDNDLAMLKVAGYPVAMGNASQNVKDMAKYVTASNGENGVAKAIRHILELNQGQ